MKYNHSKDILFVAFHYPPIVGSSGVYRSISFTRHLADAGYRVSVITASLKAYDNWSPKQNELIPKNLTVKRAWALNVRKHFSIKGKYLAIMSIPDYWQTWIWGGFITGVWSGLRNRPKLIFSTYPIASAHIIGYLLHKILRVPWIADLRDPMAQNNYPANKQKRNVFLWIERKIVENCAFAVVTAPSAKAFYMERYPHSSDRFWKVLPNGYDEATFQAVIDEVSQKGFIPSQPKNKTILLHSGIIYPRERDPTALFNAVAELKKEQKISSESLEVRLRASGNDDVYAAIIKQLNIGDIVKLAPTVSYKEAIREMMEVDGFVLMQSAGCNHQIPAKSYEYIKLKKPILGLMPKEGDTGKLIASLHIAEIADLIDQEEIKRALQKFLAKLSNNDYVMPTDDIVERFSRHYQAVLLQQYIDDMPTEDVISSVNTK